MVLADPSVSEPAEVPSFCWKASLETMYLVRSRESELSFSQLKYLSLNLQKVVMNICAFTTLIQKTRGMGKSYHMIAFFSIISLSGHTIFKCLLTKTARHRASPSCNRKSNQVNFYKSVSFLALL